MFITINDFDPTDHAQVEVLNTLTGALLAGPRDEVAASGSNSFTVHAEVAREAAEPEEFSQAEHEEDRDHEAAAMAAVYGEQSAAPAPSQAAEQRVSPYGFADPDREPGKPGGGRKRRTKAEMAEDEAYEARKAQQVTEEPQADAEPQAPVAESPFPPQQAPPADLVQAAQQGNPFPPQQEQPQAAPAQAPPPSSSPFNF